MRRHVRDKEWRARYLFFSFVVTEKKNSVRPGIRGNDNRPMSREGVIGRDRPMTSISLCHSLEPRVSLNINYYCHFDTFHKSARRKYYVHVCRDNPDLVVKRFPPGEPAVVSRVLQKLNWYFCVTDNDISSVVEILQRICKRVRNTLDDVKLFPSNFKWNSRVQYIYIYTWESEI